MKKNDILCTCNLCGSNYVAPYDNTTCCDNCMQNYINPNIKRIEDYYKKNRDAAVSDLSNKKIVVMPPIGLYMSYDSFIKMVIDFCDIGKPKYGIKDKENKEKYEQFNALTKSSMGHSALVQDLKILKKGNTSLIKR